MSGDWGGGGRGRWLVGAQNSIPLAVGGAAVPCSNTISWNTTSEFIFFFLIKLLIGFYLVNLVGHVKIT